MINRIILKTLVGLNTIFFATFALASPQAMITHNLTTTTTNAYVDGMAAPEPAAPNSTTRVPWHIVKLGCHKHRTEGVCPAVIKMDIDSDSAIEIGTLYVNLDNGVITPAKISAHGFAVYVNAPGEITVVSE
ncbi:hypothetical protein ACNVED_15570 (plasmid) [Legionella sp. D16C41]|uniref:hypothetical protein n=1 Tax=Legionella sp. D16C41 TaxID=3402688 RepID=UPI003AF59559